LSHRFSVVIVGAGTLGLCTAHALVEAGMRDVAVIDGRHVAGGSSGLSVGIIETQYLDPLAIELRVQSMRLFEQMERERGLPIVRNGYLRAAHSDADLEAFAASVAVQRELGVREATVVDRAGLRRLIPDMEVSDLSGGLFGARDGYLDGHLLCTLLAEWLAERDVPVVAGAPLTEHELDAGRHRLLAAGEAYEAEIVINAAGGWAGRVGDLLGAPVPILPQRHQALVVGLDRELDYVMPSLMDYIPASGAIGLYFRHEAADRLIAGLHTEDVLEAVADPDDAGRRQVQEFTEQVAERFAARMPGLGEAGLGDVWAGIYPMTPDGLPIVGPEPAGSIVTVAGAGGSGIQSAPALGGLAADWIVHGEPRRLPAAAVLKPGRASLETRPRDLT
jgi:sarcosine oxidase subunit beta